MRHESYARIPAASRIKTSVTAAAGRLPSLCRLILMGNSMGGHIAILEAAQHPGWIASMVLVDPAIPGLHVHRPEPVMLGAMAALSIPGLAETLLGRRLRELGPEGLTRQALALVCADPSRVDPGIVEAHIRL
ncbi:MAG: lysophospholipase, partial [Chloroflexi bacterium]